MSELNNAVNCQSLPFALRTWLCALLKCVKPTVSIIKCGFIFESSFLPGACIFLHVLVCRLVKK